MKNKFAPMLIAFLVGAIIGAGIIWLCCCGCCQKSCEKQCQVVKPRSLLDEPKLIDVAAARTSIQTYRQAPVSVDTLKGFAINLEQYYAMGLILNADTTVHGFRIYMAADSIPSNLVMIVVGTGSPDKTSSAYSTKSSGSGPCPFICDSSSPFF
jgi:hypothetical protein